ncbi:MAG: hypothetical protein IT381_05570 [Deltaproteobacteria bacterium]|nr:hypothetical protein [Deltaproteobacteria bacterium]
MILLALLVLASPDLPELQAASPFYLRVSKTEAGYEIALMNRSKKPHYFYFDSVLQPVEPVLVDVEGRIMTALRMDAPALARDARAWRKNFRWLGAGQQVPIASATISGSALEKFRLDSKPFMVDLLDAGRYKLSFVWRSRVQKCEDCTPEQDREHDKLWTGVIRSNELEVVLK